MANRRGPGHRQPAQRARDNASARLLDRFGSERVKDRCGWLLPKPDCRRVMVVRFDQVSESNPGRRIAGPRSSSTWSKVWRRTSSERAKMAAKSPPEILSPSDRPRPLRESEHPREPGLPLVCADVPLHRGPAESPLLLRTARGPLGQVNTCTPVEGLTRNPGSALSDTAPNANQD
jgi:hypothetical protein